MDRPTPTEAVVDLGDARDETRGAMPFGLEDVETGFFWIAGGIDAD